MNARFVLKTNNINTIKYIEVNMEEYIKKQLEIIQKINRATTLMLRTQTNALSDLEEMQKVITSYIEDIQNYMDRQVAKDSLQKYISTKRMDE